MNYFDRMRAGFQDELEKISGELQGFTRVGRKPIGVERMIERESESETTPSDVVQESVPMAKISNVVQAVSPEMKNRLGKTLATLGAGAAGYHVLRKANEDRRLGRQVRLQNQ